MARQEPFDDDMMTLIMGIEPDDPGQHGRTKAPRPDKDAVGVISQIRDICEEFLMRAGKDSDGGEHPRPTSDSKDSRYPKRNNFDTEDEEE